MTFFCHNDFSFTRLFVAGINQTRELISKKDAFSVKKQIVASLEFSNVFCSTIINFATTMGTPNNRDFEDIPTDGSSDFHSVSSNKSCSTQNSS